MRHHRSTVPVSEYQMQTLTQARWHGQRAITSTIYSVYLEGTMVSRFPVSRTGDMDTQRPRTSLPPSSFHISCACSDETSQTTGIRKGLFRTPSPPYQSTTHPILRPHPLPRALRFKRRPLSGVVAVLPRIWWTKDLVASRYPVSHVRVQYWVVIVLQVWRWRRLAAPGDRMCVDM